MRISRRLFYGIVFILIVACAILIIKFAFASEKKKILNVIYEGKAAIEAEDVAKCMSHVSLQYLDDYGLRYLIVQRILTEAFKTFDGFKVFLDNIEIEVDNNKEKAVASFDMRIVVTLQNQPGYLVGTNDGPAKVRMYFIKERLKWQVIKVDGIKVPYI